jgi:hypothetical protein
VYRRQHLAGGRRHCPEDNLSQVMVTRTCHMSPRLEIGCELMLLVPFMDREFAALPFASFSALLLHFHLTTNEPNTQKATIIRTLLPLKFQKLLGDSLHIGGKVLEYMIM